MKIEFYLDYLCPKCYLQQKVIEQMIKKQEISEDVVIYRSFEMVDAYEFDESLNFVDFIVKYKQLPKNEVIDFLNKTNMEIQLFPIHNVHKMAHLAKKMKLSYGFNKAVFKAIYEDHINLSQIHELRQLAINVGLPEDEVNDVLCTSKYSDAVISNKENGQLKGVESLPFLRINQLLKLNGLQDEETILNALHLSLENKINEHCTGSNCIRKKNRSKSV
ncbi:MAG: DsbA family protein [Acholeplasmataceae bacterium]